MQLLLIIRGSIHENHRLLDLPHEPPRARTVLNARPSQREEKQDMDQDDVIVGTMAGNDDTIDPENDNE